MSLFKATRREELLISSPGREGVPISSAQQGVSMELLMKLEAFITDQTDDDPTATVLNSSSFNGL